MLHCHVKLFLERPTETVFIEKHREGQELESQILYLNVMNFKNVEDYVVYNMLRMLTRMQIVSNKW